MNYKDMTLWEIAVIVDAAHKQDDLLYFTYQDGTIVPVCIKCVENGRIILQEAP